MSKWKWWIFVPFRKVKLSKLHRFGYVVCCMWLWLYCTWNIWRFVFLDFREELKINEIKIGNTNIGLVGLWQSVMFKLFQKALENSSNHVHKLWCFYRFHSNSCACLFIGWMEETPTSENRCDNRFFLAFHLSNVPSYDWACAEAEITRKSEEKFRSCRRDVTTSKNGKFLSLATKSNPNHSHAMWMKKKFLIATN